MSEPIPAATHARTILAAHEHRRQIAPLTGWDPGLDLASAYRVAEAVRRLRAGRGERTVGYKIGFTNTTLWDRYGVRAPIWGHVYDTTLRDRATLPGPVALAAFVEPRIEPEIVFGLGRAPEPGMDATALIAAASTGRRAASRSCSPCSPAGASPPPTRSRRSGCTGCWWSASGCGSPRRTGRPGSGRLAEFSVALLRDGAVADRGGGRNVLGAGPLAALSHLVDALANDSAGSRLTVGAVVTTGTLTDALPVASGQVWSLRLDGLPLPGIDLALI
ncbi:2-keto-4-pentenoate hydratase [Methylobacterium phyllosphaerae]